MRTQAEVRVVRKAGEEKREKERYLSSDEVFFCVGAAVRCGAHEANPHVIGGIALCVIFTRTRTRAQHTYTIAHTRACTRARQAANTVER